MKLNNLQAFVPAKGSIPLTNTISIGIKCKCEDELPLTDAPPVKKKAKLKFVPSSETPVGLTWDEDNYSCAYDSIFTILCNIWIQDTKKWTKLFCWLSKPLEKLAYNYREVLRGKKTLEGARNNVRRMLYESDSKNFPYGKTGTNIFELACKLMIDSQTSCYGILKLCGCGPSLHVASTRPFFVILR